MRTLLAAVLAAACAVVSAAEVPTIEIVIKNHKFVPATITIPADTKVKLLVKNEDPTPEEFESHSLNREKVIPGNSKAVIFVGPLPPGEHKFFGEFNEATAQGTLIVK